MPKSSSKKKKEKNADFQKTKLKVGKKKAVDPSQETDTSFKSKSIVIPTQSILKQENNVELKNSKNVSLSTLLAQLNHHNTGVKKDALSGLGDLIGLHPQILVSQLSLIMDGLCKLYLDEDASVRKKLLQFLTSYLVPIDKKIIDWSPFLHTIVIYLGSAMTHIFEDIRQDSIKFLNCWLQIEPLLAIKFMDQILPNYLNLLKIQNQNLDSANTGGLGLKGNLNQSKQSMWSPTTRVEILNSLHQYLKQLTKFDLPSNWYFSNWVQTDLSLVLDECSKINNYNHLLSNSSSIHNRLSTNQLNQLIKQLNSLFPFLMSTWVELASTQFQHYNLSSRTIPVQLETLSTILQLLILEARLTNSLSNQPNFPEIKKEWLIKFQSIEKSVLIYFPFFNEIEVPNMVKGLVTNMNVMICELVGMFWLYRMDDESEKEPKKEDDEDEDEEEDKTGLDLIYHFISELINNESQINLELFKMIQPGIWWLMNSNNLEISSDLLKDLFKFSLNMGGASSQLIKLNCLGFIWRILQIQSHSHYTGSFIINSPTIKSDYFKFLLDLIDFAFEKIQFDTKGNNKSEYFKLSIKIVNWSLLNYSPEELNEVIPKLTTKLEHLLQTDSSTLFQQTPLDIQLLLVQLLPNLPNLSDTLSYQLKHWSQQNKTLDPSICNRLNQLY